MSRPKGTFVSMVVKCPGGHEITLVSPNLTRTDGCFGHGDEEYCYCGPDVYEVEFTCPDCPTLKPAITADIPS